MTTSTATLSGLAAQIEAFASAAVAAAKAEAEKIGAEIVVEAKAVEAAIEPIAVMAFNEVVQQFGALAAATVTSLFGQAGALLSGGEKADLAARTLVDAVEQSGKKILADDATALIKNSYTAVKNLLQPAG